MKKLSVILSVAVMLALTLAFSINTPAQDTTTKTDMENPAQNRPLTSGMIIAYHDLPKEPHPWEDLSIHEIGDFIDQSAKEGTLQGHGSGSLADEQLDMLSDKIETAANSLENSTFQETCRDLLDAYLSVDGKDQTPDLIYGQAAPELAKMIDYMRTEIIGCE